MSSFVSGCVAKFYQYCITVNTEPYHLCLCPTNQITLTTNNTFYSVPTLSLKGLADSVEDAAAVVPGEAAVHRRRGRRRRPARRRPLLRRRRRRLRLDPAKHFR